MMLFGRVPASAPNSASGMSFKTSRRFAISGLQFFEYSEQHISNHLETVRAQLVHGVFFLMPVGVFRTIIEIDQVDRIHARSHERKMVVFDRSRVIEKVLH